MRLAVGPTVAVVGVPEVLLRDLHPQAVPQPPCRRGDPIRCTHRGWQARLCAALPYRALRPLRMEAR